MSQNESRANSNALPHVVIVGGGFGGVAAARALKHAPVRVTIIDQTNYHLFQPLLYQVAVGTLEPGTIASPIRALFRHHRNVDVRMAEVIGVDKDRKQVQVRDGAESVAYDYLILATGVHGSYFGHDDWAQWAPTMKTLADAEMLRRRIVSTLEQADQQRDPVVRKQMLTFVLVGAGPTGCELAGALAQAFRRGLPSAYRHIDARDARIILVEAGPRALATFSESLARGAVNELRSLGVDVRVGQAVELVDADGVVIAGQRVPTRTVLWTAGVAASPARPLARRGDGSRRTSRGWPRSVRRRVPGYLRRRRHGAHRKQWQAPAGRGAGGAPERRVRRAYHQRTCHAPTCTGAVRLFRQRQHGHHFVEVRHHGKGQDEGKWTAG